MAYRSPSIVGKASPIWLGAVAAPWSLGSLVIPMTLALILVVIGNAIPAVGANVGDGSDPSETSSSTPKATATTKSTAGDSSTTADSVAASDQLDLVPLPSSPHWKRISPRDEVWVDTATKEVIVGGYVCLTRGVLEMFACTKQTKEHESIVAVNARAFVIHTALLAVGAKPGHPVVFRPAYQPATGTEIDIRVVWRDADGKNREEAAAKWIENAATGKPLSHRWVFGGSRFWRDPKSGKEYYQAEGGELICVSNFGTAMIDLPVPSPDSNSSLIYRARTAKIPPRKTPVQLVLTPILVRDAEANADRSDGARPTVSSGHGNQPDIGRPSGGNPESPKQTER